MDYSLSITRCDWRGICYDQRRARNNLLRLLATAIAIGRLGVSSANFDKRKTWRTVPAVWSQNATLQVDLPGRLSVHRMSGSALRFGYIFACGGSAQCRHQLGPFMELEIRDLRLFFFFLPLAFFILTIIVRVAPFVLPPRLYVGKRPSAITKLNSRRNLGRQVRSSLWQPPATCCRQPNVLLF